MLQLQMKLFASMTQGHITKQGYDFKHVYMFQLNLRAAWSVFLDILPQALYYHIQITFTFQSDFFFRGSLMFALVNLLTTFFTTFITFLDFAYFSHVFPHKIKKEHLFL